MTDKGPSIFFAPPDGIGSAQPISPDSRRRPPPEGRRPPLSTLKKVKPEEPEEKEEEIAVLASPGKIDRYA